MHSDKNFSLTFLISLLVLIFRISAFNLLSNWSSNLLWYTVKWYFTNRFNFKYILLHTFLLGIYLCAMLMNLEFNAFRCKYFVELFYEPITRNYLISLLLIFRISAFNLLNNLSSNLLWCAVQWCFINQFNFKCKLLQAFILGMYLCKMQNEQRDQCIQIQISC